MSKKKKLFQYEELSVPPMLNEKDIDVDPNSDAEVARATALPLFPTSGEKYLRKILSYNGLDVFEVDIYCVAKAFGIGALELQILKKLIAAGQRGHKGRLKDLVEARDTIDRLLNLEIATIRQGIKS